MLFLSINISASSGWQKPMANFAKLWQNSRLFLTLMIMKDSLRERLDQMVDRFEEVTALLADPEIISDNKQFRELSVEHSDLSEITGVWGRYLAIESDLAAAKEMADDPEMKAFAEEEIERASTALATLDDELNIMMLPKDPNDKVPAFLEIRAGTGGDLSLIHI